MFIQFNDKDTEETISAKVIAELLSAYGKSKRRKIIHSAFKACTRYKLSHERFARLLFIADQKNEVMIRTVSNGMKPNIKYRVGDELDKLMLLI